MADMDNPTGDQGEDVEVELESRVVEDTPDGGALVEVSDETPVMDTDHFANLAESMPDQELAAIAAELCEKIRRDEQSREKRVKQYEEGIRRTGLGDDAPGGAQFQGASKVVHPIITEACIDFSARIMKEMMPFDGPVKDKVLGEATDKKVQKAKRKTRFMNWQVTEQMPEFRSELEQMETQVPLGGSQYFTLYYDRQLKRPVPEFVPVDDILLPFATSNFYSAQRKTRVLHLTQLEFERRIESGVYRDLELAPESVDPDTTPAQQATDKVEGKSASGYNEDGLRDVYETYVLYERDDDDRAYPYLIITDKATEKILGVYRNYYPDDPSVKAIDHIFEFDFIRWRGSYGIGIPHIAGGLAGAITGALRALLDSALINNMPTLLKLKGSSRGGETISLEATQVNEIDGQLSPDQDIRKTMMPIPFNPPSPVLFELMGFLTNAAKGVVRTSLDNEAMDTNQNTPVGTQLSRVEQGLVVFSGIFMRQYTSMNRVLRRLHEIDRDWLHDMEIPELEDELFVEPKDFMGPIDVVPVANPTIYSEQQRLAQFAALQQRAAAYPQFYKLDQLERVFVTDVLKIPNPDKYLNIPEEPERMAAPAENVALMVGNDELEVYPDQDDLAHLDCHLKFFQNPVFGGNPLVQMKAMPQLLPHLFKHLTSYYTKQVEQQTPLVKVKLQMQLAQQGSSQEPTEDRIQAIVSTQIQQQMLQDPVIQQATQLIQQFSQQLQQAMPQDPAKLEQQTKQAEEQRKMQEMQQGLQLAQKDQELDMLRFQHETKLAQADAALKQAEAQQAQADSQANMLQVQLKHQTDMSQQKMDMYAMQLEQSRQLREEAAKALELKIQQAVEARRLALEEQQQQFDQMLASKQQDFDMKLSAVELELAEARQRLDEFIAGQGAQTDLQQLAQDRTRLSHEISASAEDRRISEEQANRELDLKDKALNKKTPK